MGDNWGPSLSGGTAEPRGDAGPPDVRETSAQELFFVKERDVEFFELIRKKPRFFFDF